MIVNDRKTVPLHEKSGLTIRRPRWTDRDEATKVGEITYPNGKILMVLL